MLRKPTSILELSGAFKINPSRGRARENEPETDDELGDAPEHLSAEVRACWDEIVKYSHKGTLSSNDRILVEHGARLLQRLRASNWQVDPKIYIRFEAFLARMGMTPVDRSKVSVLKKKKVDDGTDEFARKKAA